MVDPRRVRQLLDRDLRGGLDDLDDFRHEMAEALKREAPPSGRNA